MYGQGVTGERFIRFIACGHLTCEKFDDCLTLWTLLSECVGTAFALVSVCVHGRACVCPCVLSMRTCIQDIVDKACFQDIMEGYTLLIRHIPASCFSYTSIIKNFSRILVHLERVCPE